jgi:hypothetical protein
VKRCHYLGQEGAKEYRGFTRSRKRDRRWIKTTGNRAERRDMKRDLAQNNAHRNHMWEELQMFQWSVSEIIPYWEHFVWFRWEPKIRAQAVDEPQCPIWKLAGLKWKPCNNQDRGTCSRCGSWNDGWVCPATVQHRHSSKPIRLRTHYEKHAGAVRWLREGFVA